MPLTGALQADFSDFVAESQKATAALAVMEAEAKKTGTTFAKTGQVVDGFGAKGAGLQDLSKGLRTVDQSANAMGLSLAKPIGLIEEMAQVSGKSAAELGKLGTAGAVAGAALGGWNLGRWIADLTGSDKAIGDLTASLLGLVDATQVSSNNADVLNRAFVATGQRFTDVHLASEALRKSSVQNAAQLTTTSALVSGWSRELETARGGAAALRGEIDAGNLTVAQMATRFQVSAEAIDYLKRNMALAKAETDKLAAADKKAAEEAQRHADARQKLRDSMFGTDTIAQANAAIEAIGGIAGVTRMSTEAQAALNTTVGEAIASLQREGKVGTAALNEMYVATVQMPPVVNGLTGAWANVGTQVTITADQIIADTRRMNDEVKAYEAETQRMADEWNKPKEKIEETTEATNQLTVAMGQAGSAARVTASEILAAGQAMDAAYRSAGFTGTQIATGGYQQSLRQMASGDVSAAGAGQVWGNNTLNVNVNNADAQGIANKLVTEMRHQGVRF